MLSVELDVSNPSGTDSFIAGAGIDLVATDESGDVARQFYNGFSQPWMVIINGVADSPSHRQWEVLRSGFGYSGESAFRSLIDSVQAPLVPAELTRPAPIDGGIEFFVRGRPGGIYGIERSEGLGEAPPTWTRIGSVVATRSGAVFRDTSIEGSRGPFYYRAVAE